MRVLFFILSSFFFLIQSHAENPTKSIIALEYHIGNLDQTFGTSATSDNRDLSMMGIKIGAVADLKRLFLSYRTKQMSNSDIDTTGYSLSIEYEGMAAENGSGLFAGFVLGYENYDFLGSDTLLRTQSGLFYGMDAGLTVLILETYGFDIGVRYTLPFDPKNSNVESQIYKIHDTTTSYFSFNYLY